MHNDEDARSTDAGGTMHQTWISFAVVSTKAIRHVDKIKKRARIQGQLSIIPGGILQVHDCARSLPVEKLHFQMSNVKVLAVLFGE